MSPLSDLLTDLARSESHVAAVTHDGSAELRAVLTEARRAGRRRLAVTLTASAAAVALAVTASTLLREPTAPTPAGPDGTASAAPTPPATPAPTAPGLTRGRVAPHPQEPSIAWTMSSVDLVPGSDPANPPRIPSMGGSPYLGRVAFGAGGTTVLVLGDGTGPVHVVGVDAGSGVRRWSTDLVEERDEPGTHACGGVDSAGQLVCVGSTAGAGPVLQVVDLADGRVTREVATGFPVHSLVVAGDVAILRGFDDAGVERVTGVSTGTGEQLWVEAGKAPVTHTSTVSVGVDGGFALIGDDGDPRALDVRTGEEVSDALGLDLGRVLDVWVARPGTGVRLVHDATGPVVVHDAQDGAPLWELTAGRPAAIVPGTVLRVDGGAVFAHDERTGAIRWSVADGSGGGPVEVVAFDGQRVVLAHQDTDRRYTMLSAVDTSTGQTTWTLPVDARDVVLAGDRILLEHDGGRLTALTP
ncbi:PQQ-like beta-propeller repeat protein [Cellulomonas sp. NS3]|uniref:PQQ-like beta-propeller repeat protein n=1 Tax=Cellulomonas sp. NS3 TaxID=2973977 RepID=UPI0021635A35|nr:PQQ-like beta-propeller repeat protein [Cellulomonas sp. NS3]